MYEITLALCLTLKYIRPCIRPTFPIPAHPLTHLHPPPVIRTGRDPIF